MADEARRGWRSGQNRSALQAEKRFWAPQEGIPLSGATKDAKRSWGGHGSSFSEYAYSPPTSTSLGSAQQSSFTRQSDVRNVLLFRQIIPALRPLIPQRVRSLLDVLPYLIVGRIVRDCFKKGYTNINTLRKHFIGRKHKVKYNLQR